MNRGRGVLAATSVLVHGVAVAPSGTGAYYAATILAPLAEHREPPFAHRPTPPHRRVDVQP